MSMVVVVVIVVVIVVVDVVMAMVMIVRVIMGVTMFMRMIIRVAVAVRIMLMTIPMSQILRPPRPVPIRQHRHLRIHHESPVVPPRILRPIISTPTICIHTQTATRSLMPR